MRTDSLQLDYRIILAMVAKGATVLDLGCGTGDLLSLLMREKQVRGQGIEIDEKAIYDCVARGVDVFHGDIDSGLTDYAPDSFDYVILNQSLQQVQHLETVLRAALLVGRHVIVGFPNFAHFKARLQIFFTGRTPVTPSLPYAWYDTPNLHFFSIDEFTQYCRKHAITIEQAAYIGQKRIIRCLPNLLALSGIFLISQPR